MTALTVSVAVDAAVNSHSIPAQADAVVIGAGAFGFATAYHLAKLGAGRVVLLDQYEPATQTSPKAAGLFKMLQATETKTALARLSRDIVTGFETETGIPMIHTKAGSILAARTPLHASMIDAEIEDARSWGVEAHRMEGQEAHRLCSWLMPDELLSAWYMQDDMYIEEPRSLLLAYWQAARNLGVQVIGHTPVIGIGLESGRVARVDTSQGAIQTPVVVDTAGVWSAWIGKMAGVSVPVQPMRHQLRITAPVAGIDAKDPIVRLVDASTYVRPARGGFMIGGFESEPMPIAPISQPGFSLDMVPIDFQLVDQFVEAVRTSIPAVAGVPAQEERGGLFTMTADGEFMVGPVQGAAGFWVATGCNGSGFSLSSGVGRCLAELIVGSESSIDIGSLSPRRFSGSGLDAEYLQSASIRQYANYYTPNSR